MDIAKFVTGLLGRELFETGMERPLPFIELSDDFCYGTVFPFELPEKHHH